MEKRAHVRQHVDFEVIVSSDSIKDQKCHVKDFCIGGMLVSWDQADVSNNPNLNTLVRDDALRVSVDIPENIAGAPKHYELRAKAARISGNNMGIAFIHPDTNAIASIQQMTQNNAPRPNIKPKQQGFGGHSPLETPHFNSAAKKTARQKFTETQERQILKQSLGVIEEFFDQKIGTYFQELDQKLQDAIDNARDNAEQNHLFDAVNRFKKSSQGAEARMKSDMRRPFDDYALRNAFDLSFLRKDSGSQKISLIDKDEFEDWLVVKVMATKVETAHHDELLELQLRFGALSGLMQGVQNNPIAPAVVCYAFNEVMGSLPLDIKIRKIIYGSFEETVVSQLFVLYKNLNQQLSNANILKDIDIIEQLSQIAQKTGVKKGAKPVAKSAPGDDTSPDTQSQGSTAEQQLQAGQAQTGQANAGHPAARQSPGGTGVSGQGGKHISDIPPANVAPVNNLSALENDQTIAPENLKAELVQNAPASNSHSFSSQTLIAQNAANTVKQLISNHRSAAPAIFSTPQVNLDAPVFETQKISKTLSELQTRELDPDQDPNISLSERVHESLQLDETEEKRLGDSELAALSVIERLFTSILDIENVDVNIHPWIKKLEIPFLKLLMQNGNFLQDLNHPARQVLNTIAKLGRSGVIKNEKNINAISNIVQNIVEEFQEDISVFNSANHELESLLERQEKTYKKNVDRVQEAAQGQFQIKSAKRFVDSTLENLLAGKSIPKAVVTLLDAGWRELLNLSSVRFGTDSDIWHEYEQVIHTLINAADPSKEPPELPILLKSIKTGLNAVSPSGQFSDEKTLSELKSLLTAERDENEVYAAKVDIPHGAFDAQVLDDNNSADEIWLRRAKKIQIGDWLEVDAKATIFDATPGFKEPDESNTAQSDGDEGQEYATEEKEESLDKVQMRLAWLDSDADDFVFVNHQGMKVIDIHVRVLAELLRQGKAKRIEDQDQPIVNLGLDRMVHKFYDQLVHHAAHDELTGLMNRREFERQIKKSLSESRKNDAHHVLVGIDITSLQTFQSKHGFEASDALVKALSEIIRTKTPKKTVLAHISYGQFTLLFPRIKESVANTLLDNLLKSLKQHAFSWAGSPIAFELCAGIYVVDKNTESAGSAIKNINLACQTARSESIEKYTYIVPKDEQSPLDQWKNRLNEAITQDLLTLRCQKIQSITDENLPDQYEILLAMKDADGKHVDISDFIHAAESFEKMQLIDRWVIKNIMEWMQHSPEKVSLISSFGINLSSASLNDETLLYYIFENFVNLDGVPREKICFEVTESTAVKNIDDLADFVSEMNNIGCIFSLDDFGSESSSYGFLKNLSLNFVKIDGNFIQNITRSEADFAMVKSMNEMIHFMGKKTIAKQVEDEATIEKLKEIGVDFIQGYGVEAPLALNTL